MGVQGDEVYPELRQGAPLLAPLFFQKKTAPRHKPESRFSVILSAPPYWQARHSS